MTSYAAFDEKGQIRISNIEARNKFEYRMTKIRMEFRTFGFRNCFEFGNSCFGFLNYYQALPFFSQIFSNLKSSTMTLKQL